MSRPAFPTLPDYAETVQFFVPGNPVGKGRPRATRNGHMYTPEKTASYESRVVMAGHAAMAGRPPIFGPVDVLMQIRVKIAPSWPKRRQSAALAGEIFPGSKPDMDNVVKAIFDGMNGVVLGPKAIHSGSA